MAELDKLEEYLKECGILYQRFDAEKNLDGMGLAFKIERHKIVVPDEAHQKWCVVCQTGSYGHRDGLLEGYGSLFNRTEGWLTANDVIARIKTTTEASDGK